MKLERRGTDTQATDTSLPADLDLEKIL